MLVRFLEPPVLDVDRKVGADLSRGGQVDVHVGVFPDVDLDIARFGDELFSLGWPGERSTASSEFQAVKMWQEKALSALVALDPVFKPISRQRAFNLLRRISQEIEFQLEGPAGPLQVVGLLNHHDK